jgi:FMN reductase
MITTVIAGNPKPASRTLEAGKLLARTLTGSEPDHTIDAVELGPGLLGWGDPLVADAVETVKGSDLLIVASPTFKATYTGLLKLFLDQFETGTGLAGVVAVPLMLGAGPAHFMAPEYLLKPVLVELGAACPAQGLYIHDKSSDQPEAYLPWAAQWGPALTATSTLGKVTP